MGILIAVLLIAAVAVGVTILFGQKPRDPAETHSVSEPREAIQPRQPVPEPDLEAARERGREQDDEDEESAPISSEDEGMMMPKTDQSPTM